MYQMIYIDLGYTVTMPTGRTGTVVRTDERPTGETSTGTTPSGTEYTHHDTAVYATIRFTDGTTETHPYRDCTKLRTADGDARRRSSSDHMVKREESWERSDTDGFLSQWAHGVSSQEDRLAAAIADRGGRHAYDALFDLDGNLVAAKRIDTEWGERWGILSDDDPHGRFVSWFSPSRARNADTARKNNAKKGYYVGIVMAPAKAALSGSGTGLSGCASVSAYCRRTDGGFSRDVEILDNGH